MRSRSLPSPCALLKDAWQFFRAQAALKGVLLWLLFLPGIGINIFTTLSEEILRGEYALSSDQRIVLTAMLICMMMGFLICILWGEACIMLIGKKLTHTRPGRSRTSLKAVTGEARPLVIPLLLTTLLRSCFTFYWSFLLIIPGIIYAIRTSFFGIVLLTEGIGYRAALRRSSALVYGHTWPVAWRILILLLLCFGPSTALTLIPQMLSPATHVTLDILGALLSAMGSILMILSCMVLYDALRSLPRHMLIHSKHL